MGRPKVPFPMLFGDKGPGGATDGDLLLENDPPGPGSLLLEANPPGPGKLILESS